MTPIKTITMYQTSDGRTFHGESCAIAHQEDIDAAQKANGLLEEGKSIGEILQAARKTVPDEIARSGLKRHGLYLVRTLRRRCAYC